MQVTSEKAPDNLIKTDRRNIAQVKLRIRAKKGRKRSAKGEEWRGIAKERRKDEEGRSPYCAARVGGKREKPDMASREWGRKGKA